MRRQHGLNFVGSWGLNPRWGLNPICMFNLPQRIGLMYSTSTWGSYTTHEYLWCAVLLNLNYDFSCSY